ncbi:hypothetical protein RvY_07470 [Ramazzottius varieornatus]|uniref:O-acyltransferase n=1 Tax=Ramazzottius varieornatus TaxID=947166 RepID=A0A1D1V2A6_RAMVA|nr:hypothetical protein RvY_07470 [Ramazzottius varieornatus]
MTSRTPVKPMREKQDRKGKLDGESADRDETSDGNQLHRSGSSASELHKSGADRIFDVQIHKARSSLLSSASGYHDYSGFLNLAVLLLVLSNARLLLENIIKYGVLVDHKQWVTVILRDPHRWPLLTVCVASNVFVLVALKTEQMLHKKEVSEKVGMTLQIVNLSAVLVFPALAVWFLPSYLVAAFATMIMYTMVFLKLTSYVMVNRWYRLEKNGKISRKQFKHPEIKDDEKHNIKPGMVAYPDNLTLGNMYYFYFAPTLCYELNYPRTERIRKIFVLKRVAEILLLTQLEIALVQQWMLPIINNSVGPLREADWSRLTERLLKLAIPNHCVWLIGFYLYFHSMPNLMAELMRFADREFYRDWWNAETVDEFWRKWNMPVHRWAVRHMFAPLVDNGWKRWQAACLVFCMSAFFHEYIVSIPLKLFRVWAFLGMVSQLPVALFVRKFLKGRLGNTAVWVSLIIGQPLAVLMYFHDYYIQEKDRLTFIA